MSPTFNLSITEINLNSTWYTLDDGITNTTFTELEGIIDQTLWWNMPIGLVTIRFYAEDVVGNVGYSEVVVIKDIIEQLSLEIFDQSFAKDAFNF